MRRQAACNAPDWLLLVSCHTVLQIVTAELKTEGNKDVVIYKIRVGDDTGEWTVSRRFRNFETLHRALRCCHLCHKERLQGALIQTIVEF